MEYRMELVFEIADCILYDITNGNLQIVNTGPLAIYVLKQYHLVVLQLGVWQYSLSQDIPVLYQQSNTKKMYAFPKNNGNFGIILGPETSDDQEQILESILSQNSDFAIATPQLDNEYILPNEENQQQEQQIPTSKWIQGYIQKGGDLIRNSLIMGGSIIAYGIKSGGKLIKSTISRPQVKEIDADTLAKVQMAHNSSSYFLTFTQAQIESLLNNARSISKQVGDKISQSETGQMITQHKNYGDVKNITKGTVNAVTAIYDGMFESLATIARGFQATTTSFINAKYGQQAGYIADQSMDTVANIGNIAYSFNNQANKAVYDATQSQIYHN